MTKKEHHRHHIVIVGAGFAGLAAALELEKLKDFSEHPYNVTLIDKNCYHLYHALLYEVATAKEMVQEKDLAALRRGVCIRIKALDDIFLKKEIAVVQNEVTRIDLTGGQVELGSDAPIHFDELILALGSVSNDFGIPGLKEHSIALKELPDALDINLQFQELLKRAKQGQTVRVVVGGGGISGVETAGELRNFVLRLKAEGLDPTKIEVSIIEAAPTILPGFGDWAQRVTQQRLKQLGVTTMTGQPIVKVEATTLHLKDGQTVPFDLLLWSGGIKGHPLMRELGVEVNPKGQVSVKPTLQLPNHDHVSVIGDSNFFLDSSTKRPVPQTVPEAIAQGRLAAANVYRHIHGQALKVHQPVHAGFVFPVGGRWAVSTMGGWKLSGWLGWVVRKFVDLNYFTMILTFRNAWRVFWTGGRIYLRND